MWPEGDFWRFAWANGITQLGTQVTTVALPLTALLALNAGAFELGVLSAAQMVAFLLIGLPAGVWVDRARRRPILIWSDVARGVALLSIPVAAWLGVLTLPHLYAVALVLGVGTVFFDVAHMSFLPTPSATWPPHCCCRAYGPRSSRGAATGPYAMRSWRA
ncbi:hypothetical protein [Nonomuraea turkmeniaca]|uniref:hypothetical protein n=1 Tax=Nonomuraea turkmeniaca TaxID=103838 RepID=UPI001FE2AB9D|nr:hypothetical protein [Nonomuraea turkmeniaca]